MTETRISPVQDETLNAVRKSQTAVTDAIQSWTTTLQSIAPSLPKMDMPFAGQLPRPQDLVASAYDFAEQLLASQRKLAEDVLNATMPMLPGNYEAAVKKNGTAVK